MPSANYPYGVTNAGADDALGSLPFPHPAYNHTFFHDFDTFVATDWTVTETQAAATQATTAGDGGLLALVNTAAASDINGVVYTTASFTADPATNWWAACRVRVDDATNAAILFGLVDNVTGFAPTNGVFLLKPAAGTSARLAITKATVSTTTAQGGALVSNTFADMAISYDSNTQIVRGWINNAPVAAITTLTNLPTVNLGVGIAVQNGTAAARTATVDWIMASKQRIYPSA